MSKDYKRILITLRCEQCGQDLEFAIAAVVHPKDGTTLCEKCFGDLLQTAAAKARRDATEETRSSVLGALGLSCQVPPPGWRCTRIAGHEGPCAAVPA